MNLRYGTIFSIVIFLSACNTDQWKTIKKTPGVYPGDSISAYTSYLLGTPIERRWVNNSYGIYKFKKYCSQRIEVIFERSNPAIVDLLSQDTFKIAGMLQSKLKKEGISHFVGQILSSDKLTVYFYTDPDLNPFKILSDFKIQNEFVVQDNDPDWKFYSGILVKKNTK